MVLLLNLKIEMMQFRLKMQNIICGKFCFES